MWYFIKLKSDILLVNFQTAFFIEVRKAKNKLPGISSWFEWSWSLTGEYAGCIRTRDIANLSAWKIFFSKDLEKLQLKIIEKQNPNVSTPSIPENTWIISLSNDTGFVSLL